jgi:hypothetical protein
MGNHNSGRRPKPTALKLLQGNPGKRKLNALEPKPPAGEVVKPAGMTPDAMRLWDLMAPICLAMGTLTTADVFSFATLCELRARQDAVVLTDDTDKLLRVATALRPYYEKFGLEPVGRARISVPQQEQPVSKWAGVLG